nr:HipA family kinase [Collibacillus ludicampi]
MIVFDHWIDNPSRDYKNILFESLPKGRYHIHMIDHGSSFPGGYDWTAEKLKYGRGHVHDTVVYQWAMTFLKDRQLTSFIRRITSLSDQAIVKVIHSLPNDWNVSREEKDAFVAFLSKQKKLLPDLVSKFIRQYR